MAEPSLKLGELGHWVRHWAGAPRKNGTQLCVACLTVLADTGVRPGTWHRLFPRSAPVYVRGENPKYYRTALRPGDTFEWCTGTQEVAHA